MRALLLSIAGLLVSAVLAVSLLRPDFAVLRGNGAPESIRVVLVGIDGATWKLIGPLLEAGELPHFQELTERGAYARRFETMSTTGSPVVWTSVATGRRPEDHGIDDFTETLPSGKRIPISSNRRKVKALWNVATEHGLRAGVIGWWASWPAEEVDGYIVTDHANPAYAGWLQKGLRYWNADADLLRRMRHDYHPPDLGLTLRRHWIEPGSFPYDELERRGRFTPEQISLVERSSFAEKDRYSWLKASFATDYSHLKLALELARTRPTDLLMLYLRGPDPVQHLAWDTVEPEKFPERPIDLERDRGLVEGVYRYLDSFLGELFDILGPETTLIVASDHGAEPCWNAQLGDHEARPGCHTRAAKGVLFLLGPEVKPGHVLRRGNPLDMMPTMAWLLGLPLAEDLAGEVLYDAFRPETQGRPTETVATYGDRDARPGLASHVDETMVERLRQLGYIE